MVIVKVIDFNLINFKMKKEQFILALEIGAIGLSALGLGIAVIACNKAKKASVKSVEAQVRSNKNLEVILNFLRRW